MPVLPPPSQLLGISKFPSWYEGQDATVSRMLDWYYSPARFLGMAAPTGSGKSLNALLLAKLSEARTAIITATKGLQEQYLIDAGLVDGVIVKGQNNFPCPLVPPLRADDGPCHEGIPCPLAKSDGCPYRVQLKRALDSNLIITNYAYYLAQTNFSSGLGDIDLLILDEGHLVFAQMENFLQIYISRTDVKSIGLTFPTVTDNWNSWRLWADVSLPHARDRLSSLDGGIREMRSFGGRAIPGSLSRAYRTVKSVVARLSSMSDACGEWVIQQYAHSFRFTPLWVAGYGSSLFRDVPKVVIMSAILTPKAVDGLGIPSDNGSRAWLEVDSYFPPANTPIWHIPTARINYQTDGYGMTLWLSRIDQIIQRRLDRKGIVFTVSYDRARLLMQRSRFKDIMFCHSTDDVGYVVDRFKKARPPAVLVSPTVTTGWDFPGLNYIVVGKVPYPDTKDAVVHARHEQDDEWSSFTAMETVVQSSGRGTRSSDARCEVLITDDNWRWFYPRYRKYAPKWFQDRVRGSLNSVPDPLV